MALPKKFPRIIVKEAIGWLRNLLEMQRILDDRYDQIVENVQQIDEELDIKYVSSDTEPTISAVGNALFWHDSANGKYYLVLKDSTGQKKVELI